MHAQSEVKVVECVAEEGASLGSFPFDLTLVSFHL